jgi:hypothetical protein
MCRGCGCVVGVKVVDDGSYRVTQAADFRAVEGSNLDMLD